MENYKVVLFKNKQSKKILKKFITFQQAKKYFQKKINESNEVLFEKRIENGELCKYEIAIVENSSSQLIPVYLTDEIGRNVKVRLENSGMTIIEITNFKKEEKIFDISQKKKVEVSEIIKKYLGGSGVKMISGLNNKIIIQNDDKFNLFSLKNSDETKRILGFLSDFFISTNKKDCLIIQDSSTAQKKYLLDLLSKNGVEKKILYRKFTTYSRRS